MNFNVFHDNSISYLMYYLYDVGHGDCMLVSDRYDESLLVDVGSKRPRRHLDVPSDLSQFLPGKSNALIVSHYHNDHYNLLGRILNYDSLFKKVYVPELPYRGQGLLAGQFIRGYVSLAVYSLYSYYWELPRVLRNPRILLEPLSIGDLFREVGHSFKTLWPDLTSHLCYNKQVVVSSQDSMDLLTRVVEDRGLDFRFYTGNSTEGFFRYLNEIMDVSIETEDREAIHNVLDFVERPFTEVANLFSIVASSYYMPSDRILLLGDADEDVLGEVVIPGSRNYRVIKASHHGTVFGSSLEKLLTENLTISRSTVDFPTITRVNPDYYLKMKSNRVLSTENLGHCQII